MSDTVSQAHYVKVPNANWSTLAGCRFFLAFVVLCVHIESFDPATAISFVALFDGKAAVVGFLVISGFSVTRSLDRNSKSFLLRRLIRIYPAYFVSIIAAAVLQIFSRQYQANDLIFQPDNLVTFGCNILMLQMYACKAIDYNPVIWSLSIEFSFYILIFILRSRSSILLFAAAISVLHFMLPRDLSDAWYYQQLMKLNMLRYLWPFLLGVYLSRSNSKVMLTLTCLLGSFAVGLSPTTPAVLAPLTFALTIFAIGAATMGIGRPSLIVDYLGDVSYPLYLMHIPVMLFLATIFSITYYWYLMIASMLAALAVFVFVERPFASTLASLGSYRIARENLLNARRESAVDMA